MMMSPRPRQWLSGRTLEWVRKLALNAMAAMSAGLGLLGTALAYRVFGLSAQADVWMLGTVIVMSLTLVSQLGVEQMAVFYARERAADAQRADGFVRDALLWSLCFGALFAAAVHVLAPWLVRGFSPGFSPQQHADVTQVLRAFWPLLLLSPSQFVIKQVLLVRGSVLIATALGLLVPATQCAALLVAVMGMGSEPARVASQTVVGYGLLSLPVLLLAMRGLPWGQRPDMHTLVPFIASSASMRLTHSVHGFLVTFVSNHLLSFGVAGTVSTFQYARKIAEGLASVTVGPHVSVYHARQAVHWADASEQSFRAQVREYLRSIAPLLLLASLVLAGTACYLWLSQRLPQQVDASIFALAVGALFLWQIVIAIETVPVGVLVMACRYRQMLLINASFITAYYLWGIGLQQLMPGAVAIPVASILAQLQSTALFCWSAKALYAARFGATATTAAAQWETSRQR